MSTSDPSPPTDPVASDGAELQGDELRSNSPRERRIWMALVAAIVTPPLLGALYVFRRISPLGGMTGILDWMFGNSYFFPSLAFVMAVFFGVGLSLWGCRRNWHSSVWARRLLGVTALVILIGSAMAVRWATGMHLRGINLMMQSRTHGLEAALDQYCLENNVKEATFAQLVGPDKYLKSLEPLFGETYPQRYVLGQPIIVTGVKGLGTFRRDPPKDP